MSYYYYSKDKLERAKALIRREHPNEEPVEERIHEAYVRLGGKFDVVEEGLAEEPVKKKRGRPKK